MILQTPRLVLRPLQPADAEGLFAVMSDVEAMRYWDWPAFKDYATVSEVVAGQISDMADGTALYWAVTLGGAVIGACDLSAIERRQSRAEVGFLFNRAYW